MLLLSTINWIWLNICDCVYTRSIIEMTKQANECVYRKSRNEINFENSLLRTLNRRCPVLNFAVFFSFTRAFVRFKQFKLIFDDLLSSPTHNKHKRTQRTDRDTESKKHCRRPNDNGSGEYSDNGPRHFCVYAFFFVEYLRVLIKDLFTLLFFLHEMEFFPDNLPLCVCARDNFATTASKYAINKMWILLFSYRFSTAIKRCASIFRETSTSRAKDSIWRIKKKGLEKSRSKLKFVTKTGNLFEKSDYSGKKFLVIHCVVVLSGSNLCV